MPKSSRGQSAKNKSTKQQGFPKPPQPPKPPATALPALLMLVSKSFEYAAVLALAWLTPWWLNFIGLSGTTMFNIGIIPIPGWFLVGWLVLAFCASAMGIAFSPPNQRNWATFWVVVFNVVIAIPVYLSISRISAANGGMRKGLEHALSTEYLSATLIYMVPLLVIAIAIGYGLARLMDMYWTPISQRLNKRKSPPAMVLDTTKEGAGLHLELPPDQQEAS